jgi:hypothetical protein
MLSDRELFAIIRGGSPEPVDEPNYPMIAGLSTITTNCHRFQHLAEIGSEIVSQFYPGKGSPVRVVPL